MAISEDKDEHLEQPMVWAIEGELGYAWRQRSALEIVYESISQ